ncbi:unnamed protein product [Nesidiocoris tenuis]|uniref:Lysine-specific demethylase 3A/B tudor domain-containing protein n=1 Tax=Nesidiocoris tenuis TaxID=355587 RepID=A0A6H5G0U7_9HEMI|nr:unnamed protein product [Nesidiocoris tenuis]
MKFLLNIRLKSLRYSSQKTKTYSMDAFLDILPQCGTNGRCNPGTSELEENSFLPLVGLAELASFDVEPIEFLRDRHIAFRDPTNFRHVQDYERRWGEDPLVAEWIRAQNGQSILLATPSVLVGYRVQVYRSEGTTQWYTAVIVGYNEGTRPFAIARGKTVLSRLVKNCKFCARVHFSNTTKKSCRIDHARRERRHYTAQIQIQPDATIAPTSRMKSFVNTVIKLDLIKWTRRELVKRENELAAFLETLTGEFREQPRAGWIRCFELELIRSIITFWWIRSEELAAPTNRGKKAIKNSKKLSRRSAVSGPAVSKPPAQPPDRAFDTNFWTLAEELWTKTVSTLQHWWPKNLAISKGVQRFSCVEKMDRGHQWSFQTHNFQTTTTTTTTTAAAAAAAIAATTTAAAVATTTREGWTKRRLKEGNGEEV